MKFRENIVIWILFIVIFGASIAGYKYNTALLCHGVILADAGQTYQCAIYLAEGRVPYRDFNYQWGPYALYLNAYLFKIFGIRISVVRFMMTFVTILATIITYLLGREFLSKPLAFAAALIVHLALIRNTLIPYANILVIPVGALALLFICKYYRNRARRLIFLAGLLCGICLGLKLSAGLFVTAGTSMGLVVADGQYGNGSPKRGGAWAVFNVRFIMVVILTLCLFVLIWPHLSVKYFLLFVLPVLIACYAALRLGYKGSDSAAREHDHLLEKNLLLFSSGTILSSAGWVGFYLFKLDRTKFFHYLIGSAVEHGKHIYYAYPKMNATTAALLGCAILSILLFRLAQKKFSGRYIWAAVGAIVLAHIWVLRSYLRLSIPSYLSDSENIVGYLGPVVSTLTGLAVLGYSPERDRGKSAFLEDPRIALVLLYQVFFFLVAYPHTEYTHISWSYPTTMILLFFLLERAQNVVLLNLPKPSGNALKKAVAVLILFFYPVLIIHAKAFWLFQSFYYLSPKDHKWMKKSYLYLSNPRADIYEFTPSAYQIETVNRFIQTHTEEGEYIFEFPTTFFYFYSQRPNPSRWDYFYPGLFSDKQGEIIEDLERTKPKYAIIYDGSEKDMLMFTYSSPKMRNSYRELINYIKRTYKTEKEIGYFKIMKRISP